MLGAVMWNCWCACAQVDAELELEVTPLDAIFHACDADLSGALDLPESQFALQALGFYPTEPELEAALKGLGLDLDFPVTSATQLRKVADSLEASKCARGLRALPYARRGNSMGQLSALWEGLLVDGWWHSICAKFNQDHAAEIQAGTKREREPNLYALDRPFVRATTSADASARSHIPAAVLDAAEIPGVPAENCCFAQLVNPQGLDVDYFVSHWWGHPLERTLQA